MVLHFVVLPTVSVVSGAGSVLPVQAVVNTNAQMTTAFPTVATHQLATLQPPVQLAKPQIIEAIPQQAPPQQVHVVDPGTGGYVTLGLR